MTHVADTTPYPWPYDGAATCGGRTGTTRRRRVRCPTALARDGRREPAVDVDGVSRMLGLVDAAPRTSVHSSSGSATVASTAGRPGRSTGPCRWSAPTTGQLVADPDPRRPRDRHAGPRRLRRCVARRRAPGAGGSTGSPWSASGPSRSSAAPTATPTTVATSASPSPTPSSTTTATPAPRALSSICMSGGIFGADRHRRPAARRPRRPDTSDSKTLERRGHAEPDRDDTRRMPTEEVEP